MAKSTRTRTGFDDAVLRMATDPDFAARAQADPGAVLGPLGLTQAEVAKLLGASSDDGSGASALGARQSKSALIIGGGGHGPHHAGIDHVVGANHVDAHQFSATLDGPAALDGGGVGHLHALSDSGTDLHLAGPVPHP
ncbi:MAG: hypothetical protein M3010_01480, partial [Candidatus Dormibacteraeota bacterium]|nr:hypothetical protein [Candidatus Dormibacteraeota bacterium]